jgi:hypothetical protein
VFHADATFHVTVQPFEVYKDYSVPRNSDSPIRCKIAAVTDRRTAWRDSERATAVS